MHSLLFILGNLFAAISSVSIASAALRGRETWRRVLAALVCFPVIITGIVLALGAAEALTAANAVIAAGAAAAVALLAARISAARRNVPVEEKHKNLTPDASPWPRCIAAAFFGMYAVQWILTQTTLGTAIVWDDYGYHGAVAAEIIAEGRIVTDTVTGNFRHYMMNGEMLAAWFMLPFHSDAYASLCGLYWGLLMVAAIVALSRVMGLSFYSGILIAGLFLASHYTCEAAETFAAVDLAGPAMALAAVALAMPSGRSKESGVGRQEKEKGISPSPPGSCLLTPGPSLFVDAALAGAAAGYAMGCKIFFAVVPALLCLWMLFSRRREVSRPARLGAASILAAVAALTGGWWMLRNYLWTGNPFFPGTVGPFEGPFAGREQFQISALGLLFAPASAISAGDKVLYLAKWLNWPFGLGILCLAGYAAAMILSIRRLRRREQPNAPPVRAILLIMGLTLTVLFLIMPYSGTSWPLIYSYTYTPYRFVITQFAIGLFLFAPLIEDASPWRIITFTAAVLSGALAWRESTSMGLAALLGGAAAAAVPAFGLERRIASARPAWALAALAAVLVLLAALESRKERLTAERLFNVGRSPSPIGRVWKAIDALPPGSRVAHFHSPPYPLFGRRLQHWPVDLGQDGLPLEAYHERWLRLRFTHFTEPEIPFDPARLVENIRTTGADYVLVTKWCGKSEDPWPPQYDVLRSEGRFDLIYDDGFSALWRIPRGE
jgi:hypothetical protein